MIYFSDTICHDFDVTEYGMTMLWSVYCKINFSKDNRVVS